MVFTAGDACDPAAHVPASAGTTRYGSGIGTAAGPYVGQLADVGALAEHEAEAHGAASKAEPGTRRTPERPWSYSASLLSSIVSAGSAFVQSIPMRLIAAGPLPRHVAFIMDGNRRWSRANGLAVRQGHQMGFEALKRVLEMCMALDGIHTVTVYAFAIDNFKRDKDEVSALMELAKVRLMELCEHGAVVSRYSVRIRIVGRRDLLPPDVQDAVHTIEKATRHNVGATLNVCMPYSAQDEICQAAARCLLRRNIGDAYCAADAVTAAELDRAMLLPNKNPVDLLVRTSHVSRLSDFLLWQCNERTQIQFVDQYWPMFGAREMVPILLQYQRTHMFG
ncbi:ditrans,polycis-polyprenyl diphosphate synthase [(2E,6E)-farnesydiphosphate specific] [Malassezia sp. CBS 17886]|nr:ditrans,polycis-polyprenyl diphosphate synthase [(2E,6E)-farnesydiphosphate specific] [Malassezia sp. CBS 17886]